MKINNQFILLFLSYFLIFHAKALNIEKLELISINITNKTLTNQSLYATFQSNVGHRTFTRTFNLQPNELKNIKTRMKNIIKNISLGDSQLVINTFYNKYNEIDCLLIEETKKADFPLIVDFDQALQANPGLFRCISPPYSKKIIRRLPKNVNPTTYLDRLKKLYTKNGKYLSNKPQNKTLKIPKIIHRIWFGNPLPSHYQEWQKEWEQKHAAWAFKFWNEQTIKKAFPKGLANQTTFDDALKHKNYAKMADIVRYEVLEKFGGLYIDYDVQCFESFDSLHYAYDFYVGLEEMHNEMELGNAVIGCKPHHPVIKKCIELIQSYEKKEPSMDLWKTENKRLQEVYKTLVTTGPVVLTKAFWDKADQQNNRDIVFPSIYFYCSSKTHPASFCNHVFHSSWIKKLNAKNKS